MHRRAQFFNADFKSQEKPKRSQKHRQMVLIDRIILDRCADYFFAHRFKSDVIFYGWVLHIFFEW